MENYSDEVLHFSIGSMNIRFKIITCSWESMYGFGSSYGLNKQTIISPVQYDKMTATDMKSYYMCTSYPKFILKIFYSYFKLVGHLFNF